MEVSPLGWSCFWSRRAAIWLWLEPRARASHFPTPVGVGRSSSIPNLSERDFGAVSCDDVVCAARRRRRGFTVRFFFPSRFDTCLCSRHELPTSLVFSLPFVIAPSWLRPHLSPRPDSPPFSPPCLLTLVRRVAKVPEVCAPPVIRRRLNCLGMFLRCAPLSNQSAVSDLVLRRSTAASSFPSEHRQARNS